MNTIPPLPDSPRNSGLAVWSLVLGILSVVCFYIFTAIPAVICGHVALSRIKRSGGALGGNGLAIAGLVTGYLAIAMSILIIPMVAAIAIPSFVKARDTARQNACINNLRQIDGAKHGWALENRKQPGEAVDEGAVNHYLKHGVSPVCPAGGAYTYGSVGEVPTCSAPSHEIPAR